MPKFNRPRPTALAMKLKSEEELCRQEELKMLERIDIAEWAALVVPVMKPTSWTFQEFLSGFKILNIYERFRFYTGIQTPL